MNIEECKKLIIKIITSSQDIEYLIAVYTFATNYPDQSKKRE